MPKGNKGAPRPTPKDQPMPSYQYQQPTVGTFVAPYNERAAQEKRSGEPIEKPHKDGDGRLQNFHLARMA